MTMPQQTVDGWRCQLGRHIHTELAWNNAMFMWRYVEFLGPNESAMKTSKLLKNTISNTRRKTSTDISVIQKPSTADLQNISRNEHSHGGFPRRRTLIFLTTSSCKKKSGWTWVARLTLRMFVAPKLALSAFQTQIAHRSSNPSSRNCRWRTCRGLPPANQRDSATTDSADAFAPAGRPPSDHGMRKAPPLCRSSGCSASRGRRELSQSFVTCIPFSTDVSALTDYRWTRSDTQAVTRTHTHTPSTLPLTQRLDLDTEKLTATATTTTNTSTSTASVRTTHHHHPNEVSPFCVSTPDSPENSNISEIAQDLRHV